MMRVFYLDNTPGEMGCVMKAEDAEGRRFTLRSGWYRELSYWFPARSTVGPFPTREAALEEAEEEDG